MIIMHLNRFLFSSIFILFLFSTQLAHCRPQQQLPVVRPAHFLPKGFFSHSPSSGKDGHLVPESFYRGAADVNPLSESSKRDETSLSSINIIPVTSSSSGSDYNPQRPTQQQVDSYTNIGSSNNGDTSVSNAGDYGETVPGQTSNLVPATFGSYSNNN